MIFWIVQYCLNGNIFKNREDRYRAKDSQRCDWGLCSLSNCTKNVMSLQHLLTEVSSSCINSCPNLDAAKTSFSQGVMDNWPQSFFHSGLFPPLPWSVIPSLEETWRKLNCGVQWGRCPVRTGCVMCSCSCARLGKLKMGRRSGMFRGWGGARRGRAEVSVWLC